MQFWNRWYDPQVGKWVSEDPIRQGGGVNLYGYAGNNPGRWEDPSGLRWVYYQSSGQIWYASDTGDAPFYVGTGYAGSESGGGKNDPSQEGQENIGPLPQGFYTIGDLVHNYTTGSGKKLGDAFPLTPIMGTDLQGRSGGFLIHGDSRKHPGDGSTGCIVLPKKIRTIIDRQGDNLLQVTP